jgi:hypothetical protein
MQKTVKKISELSQNTGQIEGLPKNPRFLKDEKYQKLKKSIEENPEMLDLREIICYDNKGQLVIIMGNMRYLACKELKIKEVPVKILPVETSIQNLKAYTIKDNVGFGEWDYKLLESDWDKEQLEDWGIEFLGEAMSNEFNPSGESEQLEMKYPITIIMNEDQFNRWLAMKETVNENNDNKAFFKIVDIDLK